MNKPTLRGLPALLVLALVILISGAAGATASGLITSRQIKNGTIRTVDLSNSAIAGVRSPAYATYRDDAVNLAAGLASETTILSRTLPEAGSYVVQSKAIISTAGPTRVICDLDLAPSVSRDHADITINGSEVLNFEAVGTATGTTTAKLSCAGASPISVTWSKLVVTKVGSLSNTPG